MLQYYIMIEVGCSIYHGIAAAHWICWPCKSDTYVLADMEDYLPVALHWFFETFIRKKNQLELKKNSVSLYWNLFSVLTETFFSVQT
jgi:hypothetical protein